ncbi:MotA/TolQ/ExbB proton channel family protein [candidate division KSB1 bacterium]|nr:MotA/TolQ/ExbB proton channel family protein [candidate division KSB1 bacterium]RQW03395.1 MAG: MotA/TolQ/ExbB proton channel family protein [candidate division KSB1 bacterium]
MRTSNIKMHVLAILLGLGFIVCLFTISYGQTQTARPENEAEIIVPSSMWDKIKSTGLTGFVLILVSITGLSYALERLFNLRQDKIAPNGLLESSQELWKNRQFEQLVNEPGSHNSTFGRIIRTLVKNRHCSAADLSMMAGDISSRELKIQMQRAYPLAVVATISPLLGLMGTVIGMISAFDAVAHANTMGDPSIMAESISYALVTTAMGLIIAVPALVLYHFFRIRTHSFALLLEERVNQLIDDWFMNGEDQHARHI